MLKKDFKGPSVCNVIQYEGICEIKISLSDKTFFYNYNSNLFSDRYYEYKICFFLLLLYIFFRFSNTFIFFTKDKIWNPYEEKIPILPKSDISVKKK